jgi:amino acid adenylation domain-containing protein
MERIPLSPLQEARWAQARREPRFPWSVSLTLALHGGPEPESVRTALAHLVRRHEILHTRFLPPVEGGEAAMALMPEARSCLEVHDWSALGLVERERECRRLEQALRAQDLPEPAAEELQAPLRAALARVGATEHVLVLAQSALAADWRSLWSLARELARALVGQPDAEPPAPFEGIAGWLRDALEEEDAPDGLANWGRLDLGAAASLRVPLEHDRGPQPFQPLELARELPVRLQESLLALAHGRRLSVEALLCAAWQAWLARLCEVDEPVLGVRSSGRAFQGLDSVLGTFERFLPVVARLDPRVSLARLARATDEQLARGAEWHEHFHPGRLGAGEDFAFRYAFEHLPLEPAYERGGLRLEVLRRDGHGEPFRGLLRVEETEKGCELRLAHDSRFLAERDAESLLDPYLALLESALARPDAPLAGHCASSPEQRARLLALARGPELAVELGREPRGVHEWILEAGRTRPDAPAVSAGGVELSHRGLEQRSAALACELEALGVGPGARVGVHLERSLDLVVALLAVLRAGGAYVPLPPGYPRERVLGMLADSRATVVIGSSASPGALTGFRGTLVPIHAPRPSAAWGGRARRPRPSAACAPRARVAPEDLAYVIYTSGSSGKPKGVPITHANLTHSTRARVVVYPERVERYFLLSSFAFDSSVAGIFWTLVQGGTLVLPPEGFEKDLTVLPALIERERPTHLLALPSLWSLLLEQAGPRQLDSLGTVIVAGESCPLELLRRHRARLPRARLYNEYGPTEGTVWCSVFDARTPFERAQVPIGRPIPGSSCYVLTPERELAPIGVAGELWIGGPGVAGGYLDRPELTAERFAEDPFSGGRMYRTGDRARLLSDGNLEFLGRADHQVKIRGHRVEIEEVEAALGAHPSVREAIVLARDDGASGLHLVAYVVPLGSWPAETDLLRFLAERLPEPMVPARAVCLERWPLLPNGKIDRKALPAPEEPASFVEPEGALEVVLAALWADVLGLEAVGRHDDFFALGGHSLAAARLYGRLRETLQIGLPLRALFERRTPAGLAEELRRDPTERARVERLAAMVLEVLEASEEDAEPEQALGAEPHGRG